MKKGTSVLQKYDYGYGQIDGSGNLDTTKNNGQLGRIESYIGTAKQWTQKFSYDSIGRLAESKEYRGDTNALTYKQTFDFDRFGNLYRKATSNNPTGQENPLPFTSIEETDISKATNRFTTETAYDDAGNVVTDDKFRSMGFSYDANGRMVKATKTSVPDSNSVYDAAGLRVAERFNDIWRFLVYDIGGKIVAEYGGPQQTDDGGMKYVLSDWQGSTRAIVGNTGHVQSRMDYSAFGESIGTGTGVRTAQQGFSVSDSLRQRYGLTERDEATGLDDTWFRKLENRGGRWTSPDPYNGSANIGNGQSWNRYSYVENQPTNYVDPSGLNMAIFTQSVCTPTAEDLIRYLETGELRRNNCQEIVVHIMGGGPTATSIDVGGGGGDREQREADATLSSCVINAIGKFVRAEDTALANFVSRVGTAAATSLIAGVGAVAAVPGDSRGKLIAAITTAALVFGAQAYGALYAYGTQTAANEDALRQDGSQCLGAAKKASKSAIARARNDLNSQVPRTNFRVARDYLLGRTTTRLFPSPGQVPSAAGRRVF